MSRSDTFTLGLLFLVIALLGALVAFTPIAANSVHVREFASTAFALFLAWSVVEIVKAALPVRRRGT